VPLASHRIRYIVLALIFTWMGMVLLARPAHGAWSTEPIEVHATSALCPAVAAIDDGHYGAIIVWQENTATGGVLRAQHVLADGELDPGWSAPATLSDRNVAREAIGAVTDAAGGAYVWWIEGQDLYLSRLMASGTIAPGWAVRGRFLGSLRTNRHRPQAVADGAGGVYVGWLAGALFFDPPSTVRAVHLGPAGTGVGGWPANGRDYGLVGDPGVTVSSFGIDIASDGGLWLAWQTELPGPQDFHVPGGELRALRLADAGLPASGWTSDGVLLAPYDASFLNSSPGWYSEPAASQSAIARDDQGGAFVVASQGVSDGSTLIFHNTLRHLDGLGQPAPGWGAEGVDLGDVYASGIPDPGAQGSLRAVADHRGGVFTGLPFFASEFTAAMSFTRRSPAGEPIPGGVGADQRGIEFVPRGDGGMFVASFKPSGATGPYEADAYISVSQSSPGAGFYESKTSYSATRYGDIGLAATGDGGAIFAWSQLIDRQGIFAIRLGQAGAVTGVPPTQVLGPPSLRARFVRGEGVHAVATFAGSARVTLALHDLAGRRVASLTSHATPGADAVLPGTRELPGGVYFATASDGSRQLHAKLVVIR